MPSRPVSDLRLVHRLRVRRLPPQAQQSSRIPVVLHAPALDHAHPVHPQHSARQLLSPLVVDIRHTELISQHAQPPTANPRIDGSHAPVDVVPLDVLLRVLLVRAEVLNVDVVNEAVFDVNRELTTDLQGASGGARARRLTRCAEGCRPERPRAPGSFSFFYNSSDLTFK